MYSLTIWSGEVQDQGVGQDDSLGWLRGESLSSSVLPLLVVCLQPLAFHSLQKLH